MKSLRIAAAIAGFVVGAMAPPMTNALAQADVPAWLKAHVGEGDGQIAQPVLQRARALYQRKVREGAVANPCYFAMDATRPNEPGDGASSGRFYIVCEESHTFSVISAGHGGGRNLRGVADFANDRRCARNFSNALDSELTAGGVYVTREIRSTFKGYYRDGANRNATLIRSFVQFDGEGETANARQREIGGHAAVLLRGVCMRRDPANPYANPDGYVPVGKLVDYSGGRSDGCTSWSPSDARQVLAMLKDSPTTLYIYPDAASVQAVARAVAAGQSPASAGVYWNASCLREIGAPKFWPRETLEPAIADYKRAHPAPPPTPAPICRE